MKYLKAVIPCNYFYLVIEDNIDLGSLKFDFIRNKLIDSSGNEVSVSNQVYCMGANEEDAKATLTEVDTLPFPADKTN